MVERRRYWLALAGVVGVFAGVLPSQGVSAPSRTLHFDIDGGALGPALRRYGMISGRPLIFTEALVGGRRAAAVHGDFTAEAALDRLLVGSGVGYALTRSGSLMIVARPSAPTRIAPPPAPRIVAEPQAIEPPVALEPILITALKRTQLARRAPMSLSVIPGADLGAAGDQGLGDVLSHTPGVQFYAIAPGISTVAIRGISTTPGVDRGQSVTGYFIDEVSLTDPYFSAGALDIDTFDLENVTVLRGPQGTLYGAPAFGGAINYQTRKPDLRRPQARFQASAASIDGGGASGSGRAMLNLPVVRDVLAMRATYVYRKDAGFIDNTGRNRKNSNSLLTRGGRLQLAWTPTPKLRLSLMRFQQSQDTADLGYEEQASSEAKRTPKPEAVDVRMKLSVLRLDRSSALGDLTMLASRRKKHRSVNANAGSDSQAIGENNEHLDSGADTLEVRLASPGNRRLTFLIGAMHDKAWAHVDANSSMTFAAISAHASQGYAYKADADALFGEMAYRFDDRWRVELGGRAFRMKESDLATDRGYQSTFGDIAGQERGEAFDTRGVTPRLSISWTPSDRVMAYATISRGVRYGGLNIHLNGETSTAPATFKSDSLLSHEVGVKIDAFQRRLSLDASAFFINWRDVQIQRPSFSGLNYLVNVPRATSYGLESALTWTPVENLAVQMNLTYLEAKLKSAALLDDDLSMGSGKRVLPGAARWRTSEAVTYRWARAPFAPKLTMQHRFVSGAPSELGGASIQGDYHIVDGRLTLHVAALELGLFVNNIANAKGVILASGPSRFVETPRSLGLSIDRVF